MHVQFCSNISLELRTKLLELTIDNSVIIKSFQKKNKIILIEIWLGTG